MDNTIANKVTHAVYHKQQRVTFIMGEIKREKLVRGGIFILAAAFVYLGFRFVLPVVLPFCIGWFLAVKMRRTTLWLKKHARRPEAVSAGVLLTLEAAAAGIVLYSRGGRLIWQIRILSERLPDLLKGMETALFSCCNQAEQALSLPKGILISATEQARGFVHMQIEEKLMPVMAGASVPVVKWVLKAGAVFTVSVIACVLSVTEMDELKRRQQASTFGTEVTALCRRLSLAGGAYFKSQLLIMVVVIGVCILGLWILGNPYPVAVGVALGFVDVLPILGTGTALIPWAVVCLFQRQYVTAAGLMVIYGICYFFREFAEARLMGTQLGITGLETLIAIYVGLSLFGVWGMLLGPAGSLVIRESMTMY